MTLRHYLLLLSTTIHCTQCCSNLHPSYNGAFQNKIKPTSVRAEIIKCINFKNSLTQIYHTQSTQFECSQIKHKIHQMITYLFEQLQVPIVLCPQEVTSRTITVSSPATFLACSIRDDNNQLMAAPHSSSSHLSLVLLTHFINKDCKI